MRSAILSIAASLLFISSLFAANPPLVEREWKVNEVVRTALVYAPETAAKTPAPVVFAFHGHGGGAEQAARSFGYHTVWPEAIVMYPQGLKTPGRLTDSEGKLPGWQFAVGEQADRDLNFFDAMLATLKAEYKIDERRVYSTGHSNGGSFTYLLWASRGDALAAVAPSASVPPRGLKGLAPKPALHVAGESDPLVKFAWQKVALEQIKSLNGCEAEGTSWAKAGPLVGTLYPSKTGTPLVTLIHAGGHKFVSEAPPLIVKFFQEHTRK